MKERSRSGKWQNRNVFRFLHLDEDGALNYFETSQDKVTPPTLVLLTLVSDPTMVKGFIKRIHYRFNPTNAATFTLRIWQMTTANPYFLNACMLYESPPLQVDDSDYDRGELNIPFNLRVPGWIYYSIEWTAAPGNTPGFLDVSGEKVE